jgi:hypothetical protein
MKSCTFNSLVKMSGIGGLVTLLLTMAATANAQCGGSLDAMAASALSIQSRARSELISPFAPKGQNTAFMKADSDDDHNSSIVGLWHVQFNITPPGQVDPITIQDAFQIWNTGGTEVHNPNMDPRGGSVCLGAWVENRGTYRLAHRVWNHSTEGVFLGTINLTESVRLVDHGRGQTGNFSLDFFDPDGNPMPPVHIEGAVVAERISPE